MKTHLHFKITALVLFAYLRSIAEPVSSGWTNLSCRQYVIVDSLLYAIGSKGDLLVWNLNTEKLIDGLCIKPRIGFSAIAKDKNKHIYLGNEIGRISVIDSGKRRKEIWSCGRRRPEGQPINYISFTSDNRMFVIAKGQLYDVVKRKSRHKFRHLRQEGFWCSTSWFRITHTPPKYYFLTPELVFMDKNDVFWLVYGRDVQLFDCRKDKVMYEAHDSLSKNGDYVSSIFSDAKGRVNLAYGMNQSDSTYRTGSLNLGRIYLDQSRKDSAITVSLIGAGSYNPEDSCIYFDAGKGIYKSHINTKWTIEAPKMVHKYDIVWYERQILENRYSGTLRSMEYIGASRWLIQGTNYELYIFDGRKMRILG